MSNGLFSAYDNVVVAVDGSKLVITIETEVVRTALNELASSKRVVLATTGGEMRLDWGLYLNLTLYRKL